MSRIKYTQLANEIISAVGEYTDEVEEGLKEAKIKVSKKTVQRLKKTSPKRFGEYAKAWRVTEVGTAQVIHVAAPHYRRAHLLEKGHAKRGGGRVSGQPHIAPAEEEAIKDYEREVEKVIKG